MRPGSVIPVSVPVCVPASVPISVPVIRYTQRADAEGTWPIYAESVAFVGVILAQGLLEQAVVNLTERDGQRLLVVLVFHQRTHVLQQALVELGEVGVDLTSALGGENGQCVLVVVGFIRSSIGGSARPFGSGLVPNAM